ncbi:homoserine dehydrogenase [Minwuia sp.]|uniref:homoserine dehydrogenase n=1 Tax=Minwuia sp. TaxID=2493630 RepID=UPI003A8DB29B
MREPMKIGVAGLGTVGAGLLKLLDGNGSLIADRAGRGIQVTAVSARDRNRDRGIDLHGLHWEDDPVSLAGRDDVDVVVELIGGSEGPARELVEAALRAGKPVVTANKALLAEHGYHLATLAEQNNATLAYEAAVAGGIPIVKAIREGLSGNRLTRVYGILNGTCNYILTEMRTSGRDFADVLKDAQDLGYAEADPTFDVDGIDAAHKLALLAALSFSTRPDFAAVAVEGIRNISAIDIAYADEFGYRIKLLGVAETIDGRIAQRVRPCLVPVHTPIAKVEGVFNAVVAEGDQIGRTVLEGPGAGAGPTASAVAADLVDLAAGRISHAFGVPASALSDVPAFHDTERLAHHYIRLKVLDQPGVIADIAGVLRDARISIESLLQRAGPDDAGTAPVVVITHESSEGRIDAALKGLEALDSVLEPPHLLTIEDF